MRKQQTEDCDYGGKDSYRSQKRIKKLGIKQHDAFANDRNSDATSVTTANTTKVGRKRTHNNSNKYGKYQKALNWMNLVNIFEYLTNQRIYSSYLHIYN